MRRIRRTPVIVLAATLAWIVHAQEAATYADLEPILQSQCTVCHGGAVPTFGLDLSSVEGLLAGSTRGPVVVPGDPEASELVRRLRGTAQPRMPLTGPPYLSDAEIDLFVRWIAAGAGAATPDADAGAGPATDPVTYADVEPIFAQHCVRCHAEQGAFGPAPSGYRLDTYEEAVAGGDRARVVPFDPDASELVRRVFGHAQPRMPYDGPPWLSDDELERIVAWVADGARAADGTPAEVPAGGP